MSWLWLFIQQGDIGATSLPTQLRLPLARLGPRLAVTDEPINIF